MSDQDRSIFSAPDTPADSNPTLSQESNNNSTTNELKGQNFSELVGDGKRYKSAEDLAKAKKEADAFIEQLKRENAEMREDLTKAKTLDDVLDGINREPQAKDDTNLPQFDEETLVKLVDSRLSAQEQERQRQANSKVVEQVMTQRFGEFEKANAYVNAKAQEFGMSVKELQTLADNNPKAFFKLVGIDTTSKEGHKGMPDVGKTNIEALESLNNNQIQDGTWAYYTNLRKTNPKRYYSPEVQNEIFKQRQKLGDAFFNKK